MRDKVLSQLESDEELLYYSTLNVNKTSNQIGRLLIVGITLIIFWILLIMSLKENLLEETINLILITIILLILTSCYIYGFFYNMIFKYFNKNTEVFITNKQIGLCNLKTGIKTKLIQNIEHIGIVRKKDNYADIIFSFNDESFLNKLINTIAFNGIENPEKVVEIITTINNNIHIYDDRPTFLGKKY